MVDNEEFSMLVQNARAGESDAVAELIRLYEPEVRRFIRFRLASASLLRIFDSLDIWQSVMARFFVHLDGGELNLQEPVQLRKLLMTMARNKVHDQVRGQRADRRDVRRVGALTEKMLSTLADDRETPSQTVAREEVLAAVHKALTAEENYLLDQRAGKTSWEALAGELKSSPDALRKRLIRAIDRVAAELGFVENDDE